MEWYIHRIDGNWLPILILGMVNTGIGCYFYFSSIRELPVQTVAIGGYVEPFSAALLGKTLRLLQIVGAVLILGGAVFGELFREKTMMGRIGSPQDNFAKRPGPKPECTSRDRMVE